MKHKRTIPRYGEKLGFDPKAKPVAQIVNLPSRRMSNPAVPIMEEADELAILRLKYIMAVKALKEIAATPLPLSGGRLHKIALDAIQILHES